MIKKYLAFFILATLFVFAYVRFEDYKPKILKQIQEVKGISTQGTVVPYPTGSIEISRAENAQTTHITLKVPTEYTNIKSFYSNILFEKGWEIESEETNEIFQTLKFKRKKEVTIIVSTIEKEDGYTIVGIETSTP